MTNTLAPPTAPNPQAFWLQAAGHYDFALPSDLALRLREIVPAGAATVRQTVNGLTVAYALGADVVPGVPVAFDATQTCTVVFDAPLPPEFNAGVFLDSRTLHETGFTPAVDGTLLVQSLCRECYFEGYFLPAPINDAPYVNPVISCGPASWVRVPVRAGRFLSFFMNGQAGPNHFDEVTVVFLPGVLELAGGPMGRHPLPTPQ